MNCALLSWAADQTQISPHLQGVLLRLVRLMDDDGAIAMTQAQIAPRISLGETQTRASIKALAEAGVIIRKRRGGIKTGRQSDVLTANFTRNHDNSGVSLVPQNAETPLVSSVSVIAPVDNAGSPPVDNPPRVSISTGARAETQPSNNYTKLELNPETEIPSGESVRAFALTVTTPETKSKRGSRLSPDWQPSQREQAYAAVHGITGQWLTNMVDNFVGYWSNRPGKDGLKLDWERAWEGEVRKESLAQRHKPSNVARFGVASKQQRGPSRGIYRNVYQG